MAAHWAPVSGQFRFDHDSVLFVGGSIKVGEQIGPSFGLAICDELFSGGTLCADVSFAGLDDKSVFNLVLWYHPERRYFVSAGISTDPQALYGVWHFDTRWNLHAATGDGKNLEPNRTYNVQAQLRGSRVLLLVDSVQVAAGTLPFSMAPSQVGVWCRGLHDIKVTNFKVASETPRVFVVMEFGSPFDELHRDVLKSICKEFKLEAFRADETFGPGLIIADIERQIQEAKFVIADITPANPNVFYEVGYARAINKPTILLANKAVDRLPFDVSPFRTLFYENTIAGKALVEDGLRRHIRAVLAQAAF